MAKAESRRHANMEALQEQLIKEKMLHEKDVFLGMEYKDKCEECRAKRYFELAKEYAKLNTKWIELNNVDRFDDRELKRQPLSDVTRIEIEINKIEKEMEKLLEEARE